MPADIPIGICQCGCGQVTTIERGVTRLYCHGHNGRIYPIGMNYAYRAAPDGRLTTLHRMRAEKALGKPLPPNAVVHHADGSKRDDAPLVICENQDYHKLLHQRMRIKALGGNPNTDWFCAGCRCIKPRSDFRLNTYRNPHCYCRPCHATRENQRYHEGRGQSPVVVNWSATSRFL